MSAAPLGPAWSPKRLSAVANCTPVLPQVAALDRELREPGAFGRERLAVRPPRRGVALLRLLLAPVEARLLAAALVRRGAAALA